MIHRAALPLLAAAVSLAAACKPEPTPFEKYQRAQETIRRQRDSVEAASIGQPDTTVRFPTREEVAAYTLEMDKVRKWGVAQTLTAPLMQENEALAQRVISRAAALAPTPDDRSHAHSVAQAAEPLLAAKIREAGLEPRDWVMIWIKIREAMSARTAAMLGDTINPRGRMATPEDMRFMEEHAREVREVMAASIVPPKPGL